MATYIMLSTYKKKQAYNNSEVQHIIVLYVYDMYTLQWFIVKQLYL